MPNDKIEQKSGKSRKKKAIFILMSMLIGAAWIYFRSGSSEMRSGGQMAELASEGIVSAPDRDAEIYGMITDIKGNKITILKFDPSTMPGAKKSGVDSQEGATEEENALSLGTGSSMPEGRMPAGERPSGMPSGGNGAARSSSGGMGGMAFGGSSSSRDEKLEELKASSIGTEIVVIPVGIPILVQQTDEETGEASWKMGKLTDLTSDTVVVLWAQDSDPVRTETGEEGETWRIAEYVRVSGKVEMDNSTN